MQSQKTRSKMFQLRMAKSPQRKKLTRLSEKTLHSNADTTTNK